MSKKVLELSTIVDRPTITVDDVDYEMITLGDIGIAQTAKLQRMQKKINSLNSIDDPSDEVINELVAALTTFVKIILPELPDAKLVKINDTNKIRIIEAFQTTVGA